MKCVGLKEAHYVLAEIHEEIRGMHIGVRTLAQKVFRVRYYWSTILHDTHYLVKKCRLCQINADIIHRLATNMKTIEGACPFAK